MHITLIGMSNIGKSHWSQQLASAHGFERIDCDDLVEKELGPQLTKLGFKGLRDVARWMGQPYDERYAETSKTYIACEQAVMQKVLEKLRTAPTGKRFVIDTTGSVIHTGQAIIEELKSLTQVIYLEASPEHVEYLFQQYIAEPKPVIWADNYQPQNNETSEAALKRCYPALLESRARLYEKMAHIKIPYDRHKDVGAGIEMFLSSNKAYA